MLRLRLAAALVGLAALAASTGCASVPPRIVYTPITIDSDPPGAEVYLEAKHAYQRSRDARAAKSKIRTLPDSGKRQLVGQTPLVYEMPVAIQADGEVSEIYEKVEVRIEKAGYDAFEAPLGVVGTNAALGVVLDVTLRKPARITYDAIHRELDVQTDPPGATVALQVTHAKTGSYSFDRLPQKREQVIGTSPIAGYKLATRASLARDGVASGIYDLYGDVTLVVRADGYVTVRQPLAVYGAATDSPIKVRLALEPEPIRAHLGATLSDTKEGVRVQSVQTGGPADLVGVRPGDYLERIDGAVVKNVQDVKDIVAERRPGSPLRLQIRRRSEAALELTPVLGTQGGPAPGASGGSQ